MGTLLLTGARLLDRSEGLRGQMGEVLLKGGRIARLAPRLPREPGARVLDLGGAWLSPGFIDAHVHVYTKTPLGAPAARMGAGVTSVLDAGSAGPENLEDFLVTDARKAGARVFCAMHYAKTGLARPPEADRPEKIGLETALRACREHRDRVVAVKARASRSSVGALGIESVRMGKRLAAEAGLPLLVHIGNGPPALEEVFGLLGAGDVVTHTYHGKRVNLLENGAVKGFVRAARERGVLFDVGHGRDSFHFETAQAAFREGFWPDIISTDLHTGNIGGPVYSLTRTMDKLLMLGMPLEDCVRAVTAAPAAAYRLPRLGRLREGFLADLAAFRLVDGPVELADSDGNTRMGARQIRVEYTIRGGVIAPPGMEGE